VRRSWDQPVALTAGFVWKGSRLDLSALAGWHRGWPRTPFALIEPAGVEPGELTIGKRNAGRWADFYSIDLRASYTWPLRYGDLTTVLEVTNATNQGNQCCALLHATGTFFESETTHWLPAIANLGVTYRWHGRD